MSERNRNEFEVIRGRLDDYRILGILYEEIYPQKMGGYYGAYENNQPLRDLVDRNSAPGDREIGTMYPADPSDENLPWNFLVGAIVRGVDKAPEGACLMDFPASEFLVFTHRWCSSEQ